MKAGKDTLALILGVILCLVGYFFIDLRVAYFFHERSASELKSIFRIITEAGDSKWILIPSLLAIIIFWRLKRGFALKSLIIFLSVAGSGITINLIKIIACRYRPVEFFDHARYGFDVFAFAAEYGRNSFPSGHSATAISAAVSFGLIFPRFRLLFWTAGALIAISRIVVEAHFLSDIIAGGLIGAYWALWMHRVICKKNDLLRASS